MKNIITLKHIESQIELTKKMCMSKMSDLTNDFCQSEKVKLNGVNEGEEPFFEYKINDLKTWLYIRIEYNIYLVSAVRYYINENEWILMINNLSGEPYDEICVNLLNVDEMLDLITILMLRI